MDLNPCLQKEGALSPPGSCDGDHFVSQGGNGRWVVCVNREAGYKGQFDSLDEALCVAALRADVRGVNVFVSHDMGSSWERHVNDRLEHILFMLKCG